MDMLVPDEVDLPVEKLINSMMIYYEPNKDQNNPYSDTIHIHNSVERNLVCLNFIL